MPAFADQRGNVFMMLLMGAAIGAMRATIGVPGLTAALSAGSVLSHSNPNFPQGVPPLRRSQGQQLPPPALHPFPRGIP